MRTLVMATLALAPVLVHAQAQSPAQPRGAQAPVLEAKLISPQPMEGLAAAPSAVSTTSVFVQPRLIKWADVVADHDALTLSSANNNERSVVVSMTVSADGVPSDLKIVDSEDPLLNDSVLNAVSHYRFSPASLDSRPTSAPVTLRVKVRDQE